MCCPSPPALQRFQPGSWFCETPLCTVNCHHPLLLSLCLSLPQPQREPCTELETPGGSRAGTQREEEVISLPEQLLVFLFARKTGTSNKDFFYSCSHIPAQPLVLNQPRCTPVIPLPAWHPDSGSHAMELNPFLALLFAAISLSQLQKIF